MTEWTLKAGELFKADSVFLNKKDTVENNVFHLEREHGHAPKSVANAFVDVWNQTQVIRVAPCI